MAIFFKTFIFLLLFMPNLYSKNSVQYISSADVITAELAVDAIIRQEAGFEKDFLVLHCLVKKYGPKKLFEIGTCTGYGTLIMANACNSCEIISLDLPPDTAPYFMPLSSIGTRCDKQYQQVFGDSLLYDFSQHFPIDAWFIDGAHDYIHVRHETGEAIKSGSKLIIYHDTDIDEVFKAILDAFDCDDYQIYRITDSRISYAIKNSSNLK